MSENLEKSRIAHFVDKRINELKDYKLQREIAREAGYANHNMITMIKNGTVKVSLDRVDSLAKALEVDPAYLMNLAIEQFYPPETIAAIKRIVQPNVSEAELEIVRVVRSATRGETPKITPEIKEGLIQLFSTKSAA